MNLGIDEIERIMALDTDDRGQLNLGTTYANSEVNLVVVETPPLDDNGE